MNITYKQANLDDIELLVKSRIMVLREANHLDDSADMSEVKAQSYDYYRKAILNGECIVYLVFDDDKLVGCGGVSFFIVMPTCHNQTGKKAYLMNIYNSPEYRRKGIAYKTLDLLIKATREKGINHITLEATAMGRPMYEKYGFTKMNDEMELL